MYNLLELVSGPEIRVLPEFPGHSECVAGARWLYFAFLFTRFGGRRVFFFSV
jgi:hypothetical protein